MFDFPTFWPTIGDHKRYNEDFYPRLAKTLLDEFPARPHWTKNTREVFGESVKNLDPDHLARFSAVRERFDPKNIFKSVLGEIIGVSPSASTVKRGMVEKGSEILDGLGRPLGMAGL